MIVDGTGESKHSLGLECIIYTHLIIETNPIIPNVYMPIPSVPSKQLHRRPSQPGWSPSKLRPES